MEPLTKEEIGKKIKDLRIKNGKSQEELGIFLGKSHAAISDIERGKTALSVNDLSKIASYFEVSIENLLSSTSSNPPSSAISLSHHRAEYGMSEDERVKMLKAREEFRRKAREEALKE